MRTFERYADTEYLIFNDGRVYSEKTKRFLKPRPDTGGYLRVVLRIDGKSVERAIHRMVGENFLRKIDGKDIINHIDANRTNNDFTNLEWVTVKENVYHAFFMGKNAQRKNRFVTQIDIKDKVIAIYTSLNEAARKTGANSGSISRCCNGLMNTAGGFKWEFAMSGT